MAVIYRCDSCNKLVENDNDIVKMKFLFFSMREGVQENFSDFSVCKIMCTECKNKILNFANNEKEVIDND